MNQDRRRCVSQDSRSHEQKARYLADAKGLDSYLLYLANQNLQEPMATLVVCKS